MNTPNDKSTSKTSVILTKFEGDWTGEQIESGEAGEPYEITQSDEGVTTNESDE